jgi:hypothetical protein
MTEEMMSLKGLVEKPPDADVLREMTSFAAADAERHRLFLAEKRRLRRRAADGTGGGRSDRRSLRRERP